MNHAWTGYSREQMLLGKHLRSLVDRRESVAGIECSEGELLSGFPCCVPSPLTALF